MSQPGPQPSFTLTINAHQQRLLIAALKRAIQRNQFSVVPFRSPEGEIVSDRGEAELLVGMLSDLRLNTNNDLTA